MKQTALLMQKDQLEHDLAHLAEMEDTVDRLREELAGAHMVLEELESVALNSMKQHKSTDTSDLPDLGSSWGEESDQKECPVQKEDRRPSHIDEVKITSRKKSHVGGASNDAVSTESASLSHKKATKENAKSRRPSGQHVTEKRTSPAADIKMHNRPKHVRQASVHTISRPLKSATRSDADESKVTPQTTPTVSENTHVNADQPNAHVTVSDILAAGDAGAAGEEGDVGKNTPPLDLEENASQVVFAENEVTKAPLREPMTDDVGQSEGTTPVQTRRPSLSDDRQDDSDEICEQEVQKEDGLSGEAMEPFPSVDTAETPLTVVTEVQISHCIRYIL